MLPFHRRGKNRQQPASAADGKAKRLWKFFVEWVKINWADVLVLAILGALAEGLYLTPLASTRNFPITFTESGDIVYPELAYPNRGWIISPSLSGILSALVPIVIILAAQVRVRSFWDANNAIMGTLYALVLGTLFQVILKQLVGGFRPYFLEICQPDLTRAASHNATGLNGVGFHKIMYTVEVCTNPDEGALRNAMTSFPSGHSTAAFAGYVFLFLWMNAKLKVWSDHRAAFVWLSLLFAPLLGAVLIVCSLSINQAHNWYDMLAGAAIGTATAFASYRVSYAAVWDWRYNHVPLRHVRRFEYAAEIGPEVMEKAVFVRKLGWGRRRRRAVGGRAAPTSASTSASLRRQEYGLSRDRGDAVASERHISAQEKTTAEEMV